MNINKNYQNLEDSYLFSTVARKQREFQEANPDKKVIRLSIGDADGISLTIVVCWANHIILIFVQKEVC